MLVKNKPSGKYTGTGSSTLRKIEIGTTANAIIVKSNNGMALVSNGAFIGGSEGMNYLTKEEVYCSDGLYIKTDNSCLNSKDVEYTYEVM